jgi:hypothetical protein
MTEDRLKEIEARLNAATPGPWYKRDEFDIMGSRIGYDIVFHDHDKDTGVILGQYDLPENDTAEFIANAPTDIAWLLSLAKEAKDINTRFAEENARLREALKHSQAAMTYAYEDHNDQYYLNVQKQIREALEGGEK